jgi:hypothetical protein
VACVLWEMRHIRMLRESLSMGEVSDGLGPYERVWRDKYIVVQNAWQAAFGPELGHFQSSAANMQTSVCILCSLAFRAPSLTTTLRKVEYNI